MAYNRVDILEQSSGTETIPRNGQVSVEGEASVMYRYRNFTAKDFSRQDEADDANFYAMPRMVVHLDEKAIALVKDIARRHMPPMQVRVLDLMSSFR